MDTFFSRLGALCFVVLMGVIAIILANALGPVIAATLEPPQANAATMAAQLILATLVGGGGWYILKE